MFKVLDDSARFKNGALILSDGKVIFHQIESPSLAAVFQINNQFVNIQTVFSECDTLSENKIPLSNVHDTNASLSRLILARNPYMDNAELYTGLIKRNGIAIYFLEPVIKSSTYPASPIKAPTTVMICDSFDDVSNAKPLNFETCEKLVPVSELKEVTVNEKFNTTKTITDDVTVPVTVMSFLNMCPIRPILKLPKTMSSIADHMEMILNNIPHYVSIFYSLANFVPQIGQFPAISYNNVCITNNSHNSLWLITNKDLNAIQQLYIKQCVLHQHSLENILSDFDVLYENAKQPVNELQIRQFREYLSEATKKIEDVIFCLNSISDKDQLPPVSPKVATHKIATALEKYFIMFPPKTSFLTAVNFSTPIVDLICRGENFNKVIGFLRKLIKINYKTQPNNLIKLYYLLRV